MEENISGQELLEAHQLIAKFLDENPDIAQDDKVRTVINDLQVGILQGLAKILAAIGTEKSQVSAFIDGLKADQAKQLLRCALLKVDIKYKESEKDSLSKTLLEKIQSAEHGIRTELQIDAARKILPILVDSLTSEYNPALAVSALARRTGCSDHIANEILQKTRWFLKDNEVQFGGKIIRIEKNRLVFETQEA